MNLRESKRMEEEPGPDCDKEKRIRSLEFYVFSSVRRQLFRKHCYKCFMFYWLSNNNQTDQGDESEGLERDGLDRERLEREV
jgi:hypothetical protein